MFAYDVIFWHSHPHALLRDAAFDLILPDKIERTDRTDLIDKEVLCLSYFEDAIDELLKVAKTVTIFTDDTDIAERHIPYASVVSQYRILSTLWKMFHSKPIPQIFIAIENNYPGTITYLTRTKTIPPILLCDQMAAEIRKIGDMWNERDQHYLEEMKYHVHKTLEEYEGKICANLYITANFKQNEIADYLRCEYRYIDYIVVWSYHPLVHMTTYDIYTTTERLSNSTEGGFSFLGKPLKDEFDLLGCLEQGVQPPNVSDYWKAFVKEKF